MLKGALRRRAGAIAVVTACLAVAPAGLAGAEPAKVLFGAASTPSAEPPAPIGGYAAGCIGGAVELAETGPGWQAMRLSRNRNWGHPEAIAFIERLSHSARANGWAGLYIGDISQPRGGPMVSGHRSHQIGLDIDIWLRPAKTLELARADREQLSSINVVRSDRRGVTGDWTRQHHNILRAAATDPAVARIFVNAAIKQALCDAEPADADRDWLARIRPWWGHDAHFHVRLACPNGAGECQPQDPVPAGDGCGDELAWWFSDEALNPKPSDKPTRPREITLADLPQACSAVIAR
ncbi:penicillin-insensitive murein endopeptidase [Limibaculum sp. M0105]|uniref:Penicillin-insensitive murein endopeptidase n=1 Tax=Thermohalobaculum xanthum TaxID=2753746 RepID=A0A8J7MBC7_9RHOB|nr:penicillin-insensitive murein endopeptidase [Thermohalobaculum xanthum]MBK0401163.1 penicillin-insensitive murein endopeptidase [Thermohalobaculum xanthum]